MTTTFGSDPEFFLTNAAGDLIPSVGLIGGTKDKPLMSGEYGLQEDNVMVEFTTPPCVSPATAIDHAVLGRTVALRKARNSVRDATLFRRCYAEFSDAVLMAAGPQAMQFGCSPDFDAYAAGAPHRRVMPDALKTELGAWRFAGGHIHIGYKQDHPGLPEHIAAMLCDLTIGLSLICHYEQQGPRRQLYGMAGRFRPTPYGLEYRTPSNTWLYDDDVQAGVARGMERLARLFDGDELTLLRLYNETPWPDVQAAINGEDVRSAAALSEWFRRAYP
jgi:hypothetical protein